MATITFKKIFDNATMPKKINEHEYELYVSRLIRKEIINDEIHFYYGTGIFAIQPSTHVLYVHPMYHTCMKNPSIGINFYQAYALVDKLRIIPHEDRSEIVLHVKKAIPFSNYRYFFEEIPIAKLYFRPKSEEVYVLFRMWDGNNESKFLHQFLPVNNNIDSLNVLIDATTPIPNEENREPHYAFYSLDRNFTEEDISQMSNMHNINRTDKLLRPITCEWLKKIKEFGLASKSSESMRKNDDSGSTQDICPQKELAELVYYVLRNHGLRYLFKDYNIKLKF